MYSKLDTICEIILSFTLFDAYRLLIPIAAALVTHIMKFSVYSTVCYTIIVSIPSTLLLQARLFSPTTGRYARETLDDAPSK